MGSERVCAGSLMTPDWSSVQCTFLCPLILGLMAVSTRWLDHSFTQNKYDHSLQFTLPNTQTDTIHSDKQSPRREPGKVSLVYDARDALVQRNATHRATSTILNSDSRCSTAATNRTGAGRCRGSTSQYTARHNRSVLCAVPGERFLELQPATAAQCSSAPTSCIRARSHTTGAAEEGRKKKQVIIIIVWEKGNATRQRERERRCAAGVHDRCWRSKGSQRR